MAERAVLVDVQAASVAEARLEVRPRAVEAQVARLEARAAAAALADPSLVDP